MTYLFKKLEFSISIQIQNNGILVFLVNIKYPRIGYTFGLVKPGNLYILSNSKWDLLNHSKIVTYKQIYKNYVDRATDTLVNSLVKVPIEKEYLKLDQEELILIRSFVYDLVENNPIDWLPISNSYRFSKDILQIDKQESFNYPKNITDVILRKSFRNQIKDKKLKHISSHLPLPMMIIPATVPSNLTKDGTQVPSPIKIKVDVIQQKMDKQDINTFEKVETVDNVDTLEKLDDTIYEDKETVDDIDTFEKLDDTIYEDEDSFDMDADTIEEDTLDILGVESDISTNDE